MFGIDDVALALGGIGGGLAGLAGGTVGGGVGTAAAGGLSGFGAAAAGGTGMAGILGGTAAGGGAGSLGNIGSLMGGAGGLMGGIAGIVGSLLPKKETKEQKIARERWERTRGSVHNLFQSTFYNPYAQGMNVPYTNTKAGGGNDFMKYQWSPSPEMQRVYGYALNRTYGIPESTARAQAAQAFQPIRARNLRGLPASAMAQQTQMGSPQNFATSLYQSRLPFLAGQTDIASNAAQLSQFNLARAQSLGELIG